MKTLFVMLLLAFLIGCGPGGPASSQPAHIVAIPQPGHSQSFLVRVYNGTQEEVQLIPFALPGGQVGTVVIPAGKQLDVNIGFLPSSVSITPTSFPIASFTFPTQTLTLNIDYSPFDTEVSFRIY